MSGTHEQVVDISEVVEDQTTAGTATATLAAPGLGLRWIVTGYMVSTSGTPDAAVQVEIREGAVQKFSFEIPASAFAAIHHNFVKAIRFGENAAVNLVVPSLGVGIVGSAVIFGYKQTV